ncbi:MAG: class I SAM-dependent methyltransferase [Thermoplasmatota archaeon]
MEDQRDHWERVYRGSPERFGNEPSQIGREALRIFRDRGDRRILELGCGQGRDTLLLLRNGLEVVGIDYSETGLCHLRERTASLDLEGYLHLLVHDMREGLPLPDGSVDSCFSHMFFTMQLREEELRLIFQECLRVLRPGGLNIYSVRNVHDPHCGQGTWRGEDMWENNGFVVHFFSEEKVRDLAEGYRIESISRFQEGALPKELFQVVLAKPDQM